VPMAIVGQDGALKYLNTTLTSVFGQKLQPGAGFPDWLSLLLPREDDLRAAVGFWQETVLPAAKTGQLIPPWLAQIRTGSGTTSLFQVRFAVLEASLMLTFEDMTAVRELVEALQESEERFRMLFNAQSDAIIVVDADGRIVEANRAAGQKLGCSREQLLEMLHTDIPSDLPLDARIEARRKAIAGQTVTLQGTYHSKQGRACTAEYCISPIRYFGRRMALGVARDVTDRLHSEQVLRDSEARLRAITQHTRSSLLEFTAQGRVQFANRRFYGLDPEAMAGRHVRDLGWGVELVLAFERAVATRKPVWVEHNGSPENGASAVFHSEFVPILQEGALDRIVLTSTDISAQRKTESELELNRLELHRLGVLSAVGEVSVAFAHELAQPLSAITGNAAAMLNLASRTPDFATGDLEPLEDIVADVRRLREVFDRIGSLGRPDYRRRKLLDGNQLVEDVIRLAQPQAVAHQTHLRSKLGRPLPKIWGDAVQLQHILQLGLKACLNIL